MPVRTMIAAALAAGVAGAAVATLPVGAGDDTNLAMATPETQAICRRVGAPHIPAADRPTAAEAAALKGCDSEKLYYGIATKADYVKARQCAVIEAAGADDQYFAGSAILMQIYANGYGVKRNPDLATAFACGIDAAPAEYDIRVGTLQALKAKPSADAFDFCDSITSGFAEGICASHAQRIGAVGRDASLRTLVAGFPPAGRAAYPAMKKAFDAYVEASAGGETDLSGTARGAFVVEAEETMRDQFPKDLQRLRAGQWPAASAADAKDADAKLNTSYRKALAQAAGKDNMTTVKPDGIRAAQRAWLAYRDAYLRFAAGAAPGVSRDAILARLTRLRLAELDALGGE